MKKYFIAFFFSLASVLLSFSQSTDPLVSKCVMNAGTTARYLKDFRVQLGKRTSGEDFRYKATMSLWKNTKYRFTMCNADDSKGQLILNIKDEADNIVISSFDQKSGNPYAYIDFVCNKSGLYKLNYDFIGGESGSAIGVVSMVK